MNGAVRICPMTSREGKARVRRFIVAAIAAFTVVAMTAIPGAAEILQPNTTPYQAQFQDPSHPEHGLAAFTVIVSGFTPGQQVFVEECDGNAPSVPNWDPAINCDSGSSPAPVVADSSGVAYFDSGSANHKFVPFKGVSPQGNFNCLGPDDPSLTGSNGFPDFRNCQVRVSSNNGDTTTDQQMFGLVVPNDPGSARVAQYLQPSMPSKGLAAITISASGFTPGQQVFVEQCDGVSPAANGWDPTIDCDNGFSPAPVPADSNGQVTFDANSANHKFIPFRGGSPQGDFNCLAPADPPFTPTDGLTDYTNCTIRVSSNNATVTSDQRFFNLVVPAGVPDAPAIGTATQTSGGATVAFTPGADQGYPVSSFTASCTSANGGTSGSASGGSSPIAVAGLTDGRTYTCTVTATNGAGTSQQSAASNSVVHALAPDAPANVSANAANQAVQVVFTAPDFDGPSFDNGSGVTSLTASCSSTDGGTSGSQSGSSSPILVTGLDNGNTYKCTVNATNGVGTSPDSSPSNAVVPAAVPDAPTIGTATRGASSGSVTFTANADNGEPITSFTASCTSSGTGAFGSVSGPSSPISVTGLTNGQPYTCTVSATNSVGTGPVSATSNSFTPATTPDTPTSVVIARGNASVGVSFTAGSNGGATAQFDTNCTSGGSGVPGSTINQSASPITVTGLTNGESYTCTVTAHNSVGSSSASVPSNAVTPGTVPDVPTGVAASRSGSGSLSVAFTPGNDNGYAVTSFTATCSSSDSGAVTPVTHSGSASPVVVSGLSNGKTYSCSVHATNSIGTGSESAASNAIVPATVPSAPSIGTVTRSGSSIKVPFTAGTNNGEPITSFTATCTSSNGGATHVMSGGASPIVVTGVTLGKTYTCKAKATNEVGTGPSSAASNAIVPAVLPSAPTSVKIVSGSTTTGTGPMQVSFFAGASNGAAITQNTATCTSSDGGSPRSASAATSPITVSAATTGKTYHCTVRSTNAVGTGPSSAASNAVIVGTPAAPTRLSLSSGLASGSTGQLRMSFTPGADNGSALTSPKFTATCTSSNGGVTKTGVSSASPVVIDGVTTAKTYTCTLKAHNGRGYGLSSTSPTAIIVGAPAKVSAPRAVKSAAGALEVDFTNLTSSQDNGAALSTPKYTATCVSSNGGVTKSATGTGTPIFVSGLTPGKTYTCQVKAHNSRGYGPYSNPSAAVTA